MKRLFTVYFDTNFFIWLGKASEATANAAVDKLNALGVRHVLSDMLVQELLSSVHRAQYDEAIVKRAQRFELEPYRTNDYLTWEVLLSTGTARKSVADVFVQIDDTLTEANSHSIMAHRIDRGRVTPEQFIELSNATTPFLEDIGYSPKLEDAQKNLQALQNFIQRLGNLLPEEVGLGEFSLSGDLAADSKRLLDLLDPEALQSAKESHLLNESTTNSEDRPYRVAAGLDDATTRRKLGNTLRDSEHMRIFVLHQDEIDLLQVDRAQLNQIQRRNPPHRLAELGLATRCFTASSLDAAVQTIESAHTAN